MSIRTATSSIKRSVYKLNSLNAFHHSKGSYDLKAVDDIQQQQQQHDFSTFDGSKHSIEKLRDKVRSPPHLSGGGNGSDGGGSSDGQKSNKKSIVKQNSLGFDNVAFHKEEH